VVPFTRLTNKRGASIKNASC